MTTARLLTPAGRGAIAVVEVAGPRAVELVSLWFEPASRQPLAAQPIDSVRLGRWCRADGGPGEELVVTRTAADRFEVHCHGGAAASRAVLRSLLESGAGEHSRLAARSPEAQALEDLPHALTERAAGLLLDQAAGALRSAFRRAIAAIDSGDDSAAAAQLGAILAREPLGARLTRPWRVVFAGPPNVGKSSLMNAVLGYDRALVFDRAGTTRDVVTAATALGGWPVTLADTAGVRATDDPLEAAGVRLARETLAGADVLALVSEAEGFDTPDARAARQELIAAAAPGAAVLLVANKADRLAPGRVAPSAAIATAATTGLGIDRLIAALETALGIEPLAAGAPVPFRPEHANGLRRALAAPPDERRRLLLALLASDGL